MFDARVMLRLLLFILKIIHFAFNISTFDLSRQHLKPPRSEHLIWTLKLTQYRSMGPGAGVKSDYPVWQIKAELNEEKAR